VYTRNVPPPSASIDNGLSFAKLIVPCQIPYLYFRRGASKGSPAFFFELKKVPAL